MIILFMSTCLRHFEAKNRFLEVKKQGFPDCNYSCNVVFFVCYTTKVLQKNIFKG